MAIEAPTHGQRLIHADNFHLIDAPVATSATHPGREVHAVVEKRVVGQLVHPHPAHGIARIPALPKRRKLGRVGAHNRVTTHARLCRWNHRLLRTLDIGVTIAAVDSELTRVKAMTIRNRLLRAVANLKVARREVPPHAERHDRRTTAAQNGDCERQVVERPREELHWNGLALLARAL